MKKNKHIIGFLVLHLLVYSIYNLGHPVTPQYIKDINAPVYMTGVLLGVMALAQFIFAPLWGQISDDFSRKIAFLGPGGYAFGQLGFIFLSDPGQLAIFRFISGGFAVITTTVHYAYISDKAHDLDEKAKYLGIAALLLPIGVFFGYAVGGYIGDLLNPRMVFVVQAIASLISAIILYFYVDSPVNKKASIKDIKFNVFKENGKLLTRYSDTALKYILLITLFNIVSYQLTFAQSSVILNSGFNKTSGFIGLFVATFNLSAGLASFIVQPKLFKSKRKNYDYLPMLSLASIGCSLLAFMAAFTSPLLMWIGLMLSTILNTTFIALIQDIITKVDKGNEKGALIGINQAVQSLGTFVGTTGGGLILSHYVFGPLIAGAIMFLLTFILNQFVVNKQLHATLANK
ncbi:MFS transporter [Mycoplasma sp. P36-A1]|uniref:MFS transporter n=1 Tax=Mycoplasma sp. P36-A1 TaxID=3252900 RepID=UPI003C2F5C15